MRPVFRLAAFLFFVILLLHPRPAGAYVPAAERILEPLTTLNRGITSLAVELETTFHEGQGTDTVVSEQLLIGVNGDFRLVRYGPGGETILIQQGRDLVVMNPSEKDAAETGRIEGVLPILLLRRSTVELVKELNFLGVRTDITGMDRIEKTISYTIGSEEGPVPGSRLWVEKERRLPLRFSGVCSRGDRMVRVRAEYRDYRSAGKNLLFPWRMEYYVDDTLSAVSSVIRIEINVTAPERLFKPDGEAQAVKPVPAFIDIRE